VCLIFFRQQQRYFVVLVVFRRVQIREVLSVLSQNCHF
jgi:hypothetical protein